MKPLILILASVLAFTAHADVVKVLGANCQTKTKSKAGSGIVFNHADGQYVVSSDHVTPDQENICYQILSNSGERSSVKLITSDWESGLSLLKVEKPVNTNTTLNSFERNSEQAGYTNVISKGFPAAASSLLSDKTRVVMSESDRTPLVNQNQMIEIIGTQIEYGMSGGALINADNGRILGVISHQRLSMVAGRPTVITNSNPNIQINHGLVISSQQALAWIESSLKGRTAVYTQINSTTIRGAGILFKEVRKIPSTMMLASASKKGGDGVGVGGDGVGVGGDGVGVGGDGVGVGGDGVGVGGDGVGVGGDNDTYSVDVVISIENLDTFKSQITKRSEFEWINKLVPHMLKSGQVSISSVLVMTPENAQMHKVNIQSTAQLIRRLRTGHSIPIIAQTAESAAQDQLRTELSTASANPDLNNLKSVLVSLIDAKAQFGMVKMPSGFTNSLDNHPGWRTFFEENFELAVKAKTFSQSL
jgi:hypothetical protein